MFFDAHAKKCYTDTRPWLTAFCRARISEEGMLMSI
jgi:hypothetical protein